MTVYPAINAELIDKIIEAFVNSRIVRKSEEEGMYEIAHDSLALRIAEKRSTEEKALLEIVRIIKSQTSLKGDARELFTERQLNYVEPYLEKLREQKLIDEEGEELIEQSRVKVEHDKEEKIAAQQKELELANKRAKEQEELRKKAVVSEGIAKKRSRYAALAAIVAVAIAIAAFNFYFKANEATEKTQKANIEIEKKSEEIQKNLDLITYEQAKSKATGT